MTFFGPVKTWEMSWTHGKTNVVLTNAIGVSIRNIRIVIIFYIKSDDRPFNMSLYWWARNFHEIRLARIWEYDNFFSFQYILMNNHKGISFWNDIKCH